MKDTMLELVKICQEKEFLCIHDDIDDLIESALNSKLLLINSNSQQQKVKNVVEQPAKHGNRSIQSLQNFKVVHNNFISFRNTSQISSIHAIAHILSTKEPEHLLSMGYEHLNITPETESDEVTESNAENLLPIPSEYEVTLKDKRECDLPISENIPVCDNSNIFSDSKINDDTSVYDNDFEDNEYVEASLSDPEIVSVKEENGVEEENVVHQAENDEEVDLEYISQIQDIVLREKLLSITRLIFNIESLNDNSTPDRIKPDQERLINLVKNNIPDNSSNDSLLEEADLFLSDNLIPPEPHDAETDVGEEILVVMNDKDKFDEDYHYFMFDKMFSLLSVESEDIIFDPGEDYAQFVKNQPKTRQYQHKNGNQKKSQTRKQFYQNNLTLKLNLSRIQIRGLEFDVKNKNNKIERLLNELEQVKKEKDGLDSKLTCFESASKDLDTLLGSQRSDKNKEGLGYSVVPPSAQVYSPTKKNMSWTG
nr:hypothetical protein [Tanacetum cinerariifolium]